MALVIAAAQVILELYISLNDLLSDVLRIKERHGKRCNQKISLEICNYSNVLFIVIIICLCYTLH